MKGILKLIIFILLAANASGQECKCINNAFSTDSLNPIAISQIDGVQVAFCGYTYDDIGVLKQDSSFIGSGYEIILCNEKKSIFEAGEYYTDSIKLKKYGFEIFRNEELPSGIGEEYDFVPILKIKFFIKGDKIDIDTMLSIPAYYTSPSYFKKLEDIIEAAKRDKEYPTKYPDFNLHYLFLKAVSNIKYKSDFIESGPYDGYLAVIYRNLTEYLNYKEE